MDRRRFLALGAGGLAGTWLARATFAGSPAEAASPAVTPFTQPLVVPPVAMPVSSSGGVDVYEIEMRAASTEILPGLQTQIWGYDGGFPGPTIEARSGSPIAVVFSNALSVDTAVHLHGGHVRPEHDGHPHDAIRPGASRRYEYPNAQSHSTLWYHDHAMMRTAENVYRGLAGLYLLRDNDEVALGLPSGDRDIPLLVQDRAFTADGSLDYPQTGDRRRDGVTGDVFLVNGVPFPTLDVERTRYRFRIVNGSNTRHYELRLDGRSMVQIGSDGGLLAGPVTVSSVPLGIAERAEVLVDFSSVDAGSSVDLVDGLSGRAVLRFEVGTGTASSSAAPTTLRTIAPLPAPARERELRLSFDDALGQWVLNGRPFEHDHIEFRPRLGSVEHWTLVNDSSFVHPFHIHLVMFQLLQRGLANPPHPERGWKDTVRVAPGETVRFAARFGTHTGTYVFHCHVLEHEDHSMMSQFRVVDLSRRAGAGRIATAAVISAAAFEPGVPLVHVATAGAFPDALAAGPAAASAGGPVLLVDRDALAAEVRAELERLRPARIAVLGGPSAISDAVAAELGTIAPVQRVAGADRYATAAAVAETVSNPSVAYVASGAGFADALAGGAAAATEGGVLLLTAQDAVPDATVAALERISPVRIVVLGGTAAVSDAVVEQLARHAEGPVRRIAGADRYATAAAVSAAVHPDGAETVYVATGASFPDALAASPAAAAEGAALVLTAGDHLPAVVTAELQRLSPIRIVVLGGTGAVSDAVEDALAELL